MIWALITLIYKMRGMKVEKDNAHYKTRLLAQAAKEDGMARLDVSPFLQVCVFCLDLSLPALADKAIASFTVNEDNISKALAKNPILVTALNPVIGYEKAAKIAKQAYQEGRPIITVAQEQTDLSEEELQRLLDPQKLTLGGL